MIYLPPSDSAGAHSVVSGSCSLPKLCPDKQAMIKSQVSPLTAKKNWTNKLEFFFFFFFFFIGKF